MGDLDRLMRAVVFCRWSSTQHKRVEFVSTSCTPAYHSSHMEILPIPSGQDAPILYDMSDATTLHAYKHIGAYIYPTALSHHKATDRAPHRLSRDCWRTHLMSSTRHLMSSTEDNSSRVDRGPTRRLCLFACIGIPQDAYRDISYGGMSRHILRRSS